MEGPLIVLTGNAGIGDKKLYLGNSQPRNLLFRSGIGAVFLLVTYWGQAQNLVPNSGFETYRQCPKKPGNAVQDLEFWGMPTLGSTDFFHECSPTMGVPENFNGTQQAREGRGYVGLYVYAPNDYREYLQVRLNGPLEKDREYRLSYFVSLAERSDYAIREIDALLTPNPIQNRTKKPLSRKFWFIASANEYQYLNNTEANYYSDTVHWQRIEHIFTAKGNEAYLTLGNFQTNSQTRTQATGITSNKGAYYYIDAVSILPSQPTALVQPFALDSLMVLPEVLFEFDDFQLTAEGQKEIRQIANFMNSNAHLSLEILGHTDALGSESYNAKLSQDRCKAVVNELIQWGIAPERIAWHGYGASRPVGDNSTPSGRQQNRRVEFRFQLQDSN